MVSNLKLEDRVPVSSSTARTRTSIQLVPGQRLLNRDLSLVEFFRHVLDQGLNSSTPLLERLRFLCIFSTIVDEFFMVRVSALKEKYDAGWLEPSPDGLTAEEQLREIRSRLRPMIDEQVRCLTEDILPMLEEQNIVIAPYETLSTEERKELQIYFSNNVFPVLTPLAVDPAHPFPYISGLSLNLGVMVESREQGSETGKPRFVRLKVPPLPSGLVPVGNSGSKFTFLHELISANLGVLFPGMCVGQAHTFRVTRDADIDIREDEAADLLLALQQELRKRRFGTPVRLEVSATMPRKMVEYLTASLDLTEEDVYVVNGPLNVSDLFSLCDFDRPDLKFRPLRTTVPGVLKKGESIFEVIKRGDVLLHHPYTAYSSVTDFIHEAAEDPEVRAIKICLYRTGAESQIAESLIHAAEKGKQVTVLIELKARFDEENNIEWARRFEHAGVHVVYGLLGLKTHCKLTLVVRQEGQTLRRYVHIATGNYNPTNSCTYTDLGLLTAAEEIGADAVELFNYLTGYSAQKEYRRLLVAPVNLRERVTALIERETKNARAGRSGKIVAKLNRLTDANVIQTLYDASAAGVSIELIVRGVCTLRPGVPGLSENIRVRSIVGRFLEHSRILYFANDGDEEVYIGSADWMPRNLNRRVEVVCPISNPGIRTYLKDEVLAAYLRDNVNTRDLRPDGFYERIHLDPLTEPFDSQMHFEARQYN